MKNSLFILAAVVAVSFSSCKKDYTCTCVIDYGSGQKGESSFLIKDTKKKAKETCEAENETIAGVTYSCVIK